MLTNRMRLFTVAGVLFIACGTAQALELMGLQPPQQSLPQQTERQFKRLMAQTITHINNVCELSDRQKRKLTIASKGAVDRAMTKWKQQFAQLPIDRNLQFRRVPPPAKIRVLGQANIVVQQRVVQARAFVKQTQVLDFPYANEVNPVTSESIWRKTLAKVLTSAQKAKLESAPMWIPKPRLGVPAVLGIRR